MSDEYVSTFIALHGLVSRIQGVLMNAPFTVTRKKYCLKAAREQMLACENLKMIFIHRDSYFADTMPADIH